MTTNVNTKLTNIQMMSMNESLAPLLSRRDIIGYVAARNKRTFDDKLVEYISMRNELIKKYGSKDVDADGNDLGTISINVKSKEFHDFCEELEAFNNIELDVSIMVLPFSDAIGVLSGEEIFKIDWMLVDS